MNQLTQHITTEWAPHDSGVYLLAFFHNGRHVAYGGRSARGRASHYLGSAADIARRIREHQNGTGARLTCAAVLAGFELRLVRIWYGKGRDFERSLKESHHTARYCPICRYHLEQDTSAPEYTMISATATAGLFCEGTDSHDR